MKYDEFQLVLMVTHACNLRCDYCYTGYKRPQAMPLEFGRRAIDRAVRSVAPGGTLELGFFGGEPLLEADAIHDWLDYARGLTEAAHIRLRAGLTTNGTLCSGTAEGLLLEEDLEIFVSHDGLPESHDRHRRTVDGRPTAQLALNTICRLTAAGRDVATMTVVRPDTLPRLVEGLDWLRQQGVRHTDLTLDVWASWKAADLTCLERTIAQAADSWHANLPRCSLNWFDEQAAHLCGVPLETTARCRFGDGEIAVAPSGNLYPCERLIGEDGPGQALRLPGHVTEGDDFRFAPAPGRSTPACDVCGIGGHCNTTCRCNNYVRTGDPTRPDALLCLLQRVCFRETARVLGASRDKRHGAPCRRRALNEEIRHGRTRSRSRTPGRRPA